MNWSEISFYDVIQSCFSFPLYLINPFICNCSLCSLSLSPALSVFCFQTWSACLSFKTTNFRCAFTADHDSNHQVKHNKYFIVKISRLSRYLQNVFVKNPSSFYSLIQQRSNENLNISNVEQAKTNGKQIVINCISFGWETKDGFRSVGIFIQCQMNLWFLPFLRVCL